MLGKANYLSKKGQVEMITLSKISSDMRWLSNLLKTTTDPDIKARVERTMIQGLLIRKRLLAKKLEEDPNYLDRLISLARSRQRANAQLD